MAIRSKLNKDLWTNITRLKLLADPNLSNRFILEINPFGNEDDEDEAEAVEKDEYVVIGRIFPKSEIYKETALRIEMKLTSRYPTEAPIVRFLTPIYHPNVEIDGTFCHQLLNNAARWSNRGFSTLEEVVSVIVKHIDEPDPVYAINFDIGDEYIKRKTEFDRKAREMVKRHRVSRD
ncbi:hypothetical protein I4U23_019315 [Adineta vaga]|nr:hypothetical protein I4U23_019315 [Adineta vaga]